MFVPSLRGQLSLIDSHAQTPAQHHTSSAAALGAAACLHDASTLCSTHFKYLRRQVACECATCPDRQSPARHQQHACVNVSCFMPTGQAWAHRRPPCQHEVCRSSSRKLCSQPQARIRPRHDRDVQQPSMRPEPQGRHTARPASTTSDPSTALQPVTAVTAA